MTQESEPQGQAGQLQSRMNSSQKLDDFSISVAEVITRWAVLFRRPVTAEAVAAYEDSLRGEINAEGLRLLGKEMPKRCKYFPTVKEILEARDNVSFTRALPPPSLIEIDETSGDPILTFTCYRCKDLGFIKTGTPPGKDSGSGWTRRCQECRK